MNNSTKEDTPKYKTSTKKLYLTHGKRTIAQNGILNILQKKNTL